MRQKNQKLDWELKSSTQTLWDYIYWDVTHEKQELFGVHGGKKLIYLRCEGP